MAYTTVHRASCCMRRNDAKKENAQNISNCRCSKTKSTSCDVKIGCALCTPLTYNDGLLGLACWVPGKFRGLANLCVCNRQQAGPSKIGIGSWSLTINSNSYQGWATGSAWIPSKQLKSWAESFKKPWRAMKQTLRRKHTAAETWGVIQHGDPLWCIRKMQVLMLLNMLRHR